LEERFSSELEELKKEHALQIQQEYERAKDELNEAHIDQLKSFRHTSQESTEQASLNQVYH
jgi:cellobiose-specific phosphotransferase system component IIA